MDEPITDVVFVTDEKDTPAGYKVVSGLRSAFSTCRSNYLASSGVRDKGRGISVPIVTVYFISKVLVSIVGMGPPHSWLTVSAPICIERIISFAINLNPQLTECPDQHSANLWQKFLGAKTEVRYICYTKEDKVR